MSKVVKPGEYGNPIHLAEINAKPPGRYWCKWDNAGFGVEGWRVKVDGARVTGRPIGHDTHCLGDGKKSGDEDENDYFD